MDLITRSRYPPRAPCVVLIKNFIRARRTCSGQLYSYIYTVYSIYISKKTLKINVWNNVKNNIYIHIYIARVKLLIRSENFRGAPLQPLFKGKNDALEQVDMVWKPSGTHKRPFFSAYRSILGLFYYRIQKKCP